LRRLASTDFGVDPENGRELKKGVVPVFAAGTYNPKEKVVVNGEKVTLAQYAGRLNVELLRPADFNDKLRERRRDRSLTVQKICRICKDESETRAVLNVVWNNPLGSKMRSIKLLRETRIFSNLRRRLQTELDALLLLRAFDDFV